jgi:hypothetical protein
VTTALVSAADARYGRWLLNLLGSVQRKSNLFDRLVVYDLGLTSWQRRLLNGVIGVDVRTVPPFVPHWRQGRTWKTWIWTNVEADTIVWLDAGITVLRPLTELLTQSAERGYFVVSQNHPLRDSTPRDYYDLYDLPPGFGDQVSIAAGILAYRRDSSFYSDVIVPTYDDAVAGRSLGFSPGESEKLNYGLDRLDDLVVRDCRIFRHEQTLLGIHFYRATRDPHVNDLYRFGGWKSPHDHPGQVIWSHRRSGDFRFLPRIRYRPVIAPIGRSWGTAVYLRRLAVLYRWLLRPSLYTRRLRRIVARRA